MTTTNPWLRTLSLAAAAGGMIAIVVATRPSDKPYSGAASDQGAALTPELIDPQKVVSLEVIGWDAQDARPRAFKVSFENGKWVIPSAFDYPVDATQNMAAAASSFIGALKERIVTDQVAEHARLGVVAPDDSSSTTASGHGTRVTMRDTAGKVVADVIVGSPVPDPDAAPGAPPAKRYVREVGKNRVYTTTLNQAYSTRFADWVQTDLLQLTVDKVQRIGIDRYRIDEQRGTLTDVKSTTLTRPAPPPTSPNQSPPTQPWTLVSSEGAVPPGAAVNQARVDDMLNALATLKIIGVRPKPANLARLMSGEKSEGQISPGDQASLQRHGFFISGTGTLVANEGSMTVQCADGVLYTLWIGELATDDSTKDQAQGASPPPAPDAKAKPADGRYMMVTVSFDEALVGNAPTKPQALIDLEAQSAASTPEKPLSDDAKAQLANLSVAFKAQSDGFANRTKAGRDRQFALAKRFAGWYYVVDATSLAKLRPTREELVSQVAPITAPPLTPVVIPTPGQ